MKVTPEMEEKITKLIAENLAIDDKSQITDDALFTDDLGADSLDAVELIMALEEEFEVEILDEDAEEILTRRDIIKYLENLD